MEDEIDDMIANGEINNNTAIDLSYWMSLSIPARKILLDDYENLASEWRNSHEYAELDREWHEHLEQTYTDWANR